MGIPEILDSFERTFSSYEEMHDFHKEVAEKSVWRTAKINSFKAIPLCKDADGDVSNWKKCTPSADSMDAINDTTANTRLALKVELLPVYQGEGLFREEVLKAKKVTLPLRDTAVRSMYERAKISGLSLEKLEKKTLAAFLNECFKLYPEESLVLIRSGKITACHSSGYATLPVDELLETLVNGLSNTFGTVVFKSGYTSHSFVTGKFELVDAQQTLLKNYADHLKKVGSSIDTKKLVPAITFNTSDTGLSCARCSASLAGDGYSIAIGSALEVEHKGKNSVAHFGTKVNMLFANFEKNLSKLEGLLNVYIQHPISCMERVCRHLKLPKKWSLEAVAQFEAVNGDTPCTAHDIYFAMQEILFLYRTSSEGKGSPLTVFNYEENLARALSLNWGNFDIAKRIEW